MLFVLNVRDWKVWEVAAEGLQHVTFVFIGFSMRYRFTVLTFEDKPPLAFILSVCYLF
jgi:hypothetical protein